MFSVWTVVTSRGLVGICRGLFRNSLILCCHCCAYMQVPASEMEEHWMPDKMCHECSECGVRFGIFVRKHHCRICGRIFCSSCSSHSVPAYHLRSDMNGTLRVCQECFKIYQESLVKKKGGKQDMLPAHATTGGVHIFSSCFFLP